MIGRVLGHHRIREQIGSGGMGDVYLARDERLERDVALKVLRAGALADHAARRRFRKEALALSRLNHPNIETVHEFDTHDDIDYLVMEYVAGVTLSDTLAGSTLSEHDLLSLGSQLAEGLAAAHAEGVVHLDLKPGNLRVTPDGRLKILDFGLARLLAPETVAGEAITKTLTQAHVVAGTLPYMAPEQVAGQPVDLRTDIWAAGVVLYEMATGRPPFEGKLSTALAAEIQVKAPPPPGSIRAGLPPALEQIILKCLEKDPDLRYQSARDLRADFRRAGVASTAGPASAGTPLTPIRNRPGRGQLLRRLPAWGLVLLLVVTAGTIIGVTLQVMRRQGGPAVASAPAITSLAVLPLSDLSDQPEPGYVAEALHEAVITELSKISALRVISRTSTLRYKGTDTPLPKIAEELNVDAILEGSVLRSGSRLRVTAQLMQADPERHLWVDSFERELTDVLYLTSDIAHSVASQIRVTLTPAEKTSLAQARPVDPRAYELYAVGRHQWNQRTLEGYRRALDSYQQALVRDAGYALVHAAIGDAYMLLGEQGGMPQAEARPLAAAAIRKALELDSNLSEAHASLGHFRFYYEWNWAGAESAFTRAIELNPGHVAAHQGYGRALGFLGRRDDAVRELQRARDLDPLSVVVNAYLGQVYFFFRQYDRAGERLQWTLTLNPDHPLIHHNLGELYLGQGRYGDAIEHLEKSVERAGEASTHYLAILGCAYARGNQRSKALTILSELTARSKRRLGSGFDLAGLHVALGDLPSAMASLEHGYEQRDLWLAELKGWPWFDGLAREPRFQTLLRRMNFPAASNVE
jgi:serine/threonine protein kinase/tetratricopeptide (TPR) repeat protein